MAADLIAFLNARLDEDEAAALANIGAGPGWQRGLGDDERGTGPKWPDYQTYDSDDLTAATEYIERFRPLRMLREVEADRKLLAAYADAPEFSDPWIGLDFAVRIRAERFSDHPDYRQEWKP